MGRLEVGDYVNVRPDGRNWHLGSIVSIDDTRSVIHVAYEGGSGEFSENEVHLASLDWPELGDAVVQNPSPELTVFGRQPWAYQKLATLAFSDHDNLYPLSGSHHISLGRYIPNHLGYEPGSPEWEAHWHAEPESIPRVEAAHQAAHSWREHNGLVHPTTDFSRVRADKHRAREVAGLYSRLPDNDPAAHPHYRALGEEIHDQFHHLQNHGVDVQFKDHDPYKNIHELVDDMHKRGRLQIMGTHVTGSHRLFSDETNNRFRAVHDFFGHAAIGRGFDRHGEEAAWAHHASMFSPLARGAMTSDLKGQNNLMIHTGKFSPDKIALLPDRFHNDDAVRNVKTAGHWGRAGWIDPEGKWLDVPHGKTHEDFTGNEDSVQHMDEEHHVRARSVGDQLNVQFVHPLTDKQRNRVLTEADKHSHLFVDVVRPDPGQYGRSIHSESGGSADADRILDRAHRAARASIEWHNDPDFPHTAGSDLGGSSGVETGDSIQRPSDLGAVHDVYVPDLDIEEGIRCPLCGIRPAEVEVNHATVCKWCAHNRYGVPQEDPGPPMWGQTTAKLAGTVYEVGGDFEEPGYQSKEYTSKDKVHPSHFGTRVKPGIRQRPDWPNIYPTPQDRFEHVPLEKAYTPQDYVYAPHVHNLASLPADEANHESHIDRVEGIRTPEGEVEVQDGAHRLSAAHLRGDKAIGVHISQEWHHGPHTAAVNHPDMTWHFDVDYADDKDAMKRGEIRSGTHRVVVRAPSHGQAAAMANEMVFARGAEPTKATLVHYEATKVANYTPGKEPWVDREINERGTEGNRTHITRKVFMHVPIGQVKYMSGVMGERPGEHRNRQGQDWEDFKSDIAQNGIRHGIHITVDPGERPKLSEGNHRRDAAVELGHTHIPAEVTYFGHSERHTDLEERARDYFTNVHPILHPDDPLPPKQAMAWAEAQDDLKRGLNAERMGVRSVRDAGFKGYVGRSDWEELEGAGKPHGEDDWDEDLWEKHRPEPNSAEQAHYQHHDEYPDSFHERHEEAYGNAIEERQAKREREDTPDHLDDHLHHWTVEHSTDPESFTRHASQPQQVDLRHGVYATQSHVAQFHIDRHGGEEEPSWHSQHGGQADTYLGEKHPLFVTHQGRLHAIEGHHRVAAALQRGDSHITGWHHDLDKHPIATDIHGSINPVNPGGPCEECLAHHENIHGWLAEQNRHLGGKALDELAHKGYCTEDWSRWQQGECAHYAAGLQRLQPSLEIGALRGGQHFFAHDETHAYDSAGKHPLPYHGASYHDVRAKAKRLRAEGAVSLIQSPTPDEPYIYGRVIGDHGTYHSVIHRVGNGIYQWLCECRWGDFGPFGPDGWQRASTSPFLNRKCSHNLALLYEWNSHRMRREGAGSYRQYCPHHDRYFHSILEAERHEHDLHDDAPVCEPRNVHEAGFEGKPLYHGTSRAAAESIMQHGLRATENGSYTLTPHHETARDYSFNGFSRDEGGAVVEVRVPPHLHHEYLSHDFTGFSEDEIRDGEAERNDGSAWLKKDIPPHFIRRVSVRDDPIEDIEDRSFEDPHPHVGKDGEPHSGVMIALVPPDHVAKDLAVEGGEDPYDFHVTLAYLGKDHEVPHDKIHWAMCDMARKLPALKGKINGFGDFEVEPEKNDGFSHVHLGLVDVPHIGEVYGHMLESLRTVGLEPSHDHGISPHMSIQYSHEPMEYESMPKTKGEEFDIPHITLGYGGKWRHYPLSGDGIEKTAIAYRDELDPYRHLVHHMRKNVAKSGGMTVHPKTQRGQSVPRSGYQAGLPGHTMTPRPTHDEFMDEKNTDEMAGHVRDWLHSKHHVFDDPDVHVGVWHNEKNNEIYLDGSKWYKSRNRAVRAGTRDNQISVWDNRNQREIPTGGTGEFDSGVPHEGRLLELWL